MKTTLSWFWTGDAAFHATNENENLDNCEHKKISCLDTGHGDEKEMWFETEET